MKSAKFNIVIESEEKILRFAGTVNDQDQLVFDIGTQVGTVPINNFTLKTVPTGLKTLKIDFDSIDNWDASFEVKDNAK